MALPLSGWQSMRAKWANERSGSARGDAGRRRGAPALRRPSHAARDRGRSARLFGDLPSLSPEPLPVLPGDRRGFSGRAGRAPEHDAEGLTGAAGRAAADRAEAVALPDRPQRVDRAAAQETPDRAAGPRDRVTWFGPVGGGRAAGAAGAADLRSGRAPGTPTPYPGHCAAGRAPPPPRAAR